MGERTQSGSTDAGGTGRADVESSDGHTARQTLLEESRTTANQQLTQIAKIDDGAVRTARMAFLLLGIVAGGSRLSPFPDLGVVGALGTWSLVGALLAGLFVYGNSRLFVGSSPHELTVDYSSEPDVDHTHVELIREYEDGIQFNRRILHTNGFTLLVARSFLALAVVLLVLGFATSVALSGEVASNVQTFIR